MKFFRLPPVPPALFTVIAAVVHATIDEGAFRETPLLAPLREPWHLISGGIIIAIAIIMFVASLMAFRRRGESFDVGKPTKEVVTNGMYASSRNPAYLAMLIGIFGVGCAANSLPIMFAVIPSFVVFNWYTIPREERYLRRTVGAAYERYLGRVRRWL